MSEDVELSTDQIVASTKKHRLAKGQLMDPTAPMPGAIKPVKEQRTKKDTASQAKLRLTYKAYIKALANHNGDVPTALSEVFDITYEQADKEQIELHEKLVAATKGQSLSAVMNSLDLGSYARAVILSRFARSLDPDVALKAIDMANKLDVSTKAQRQGGDYESWLRMVMGDKG